MVLGCITAFYCEVSRFFVQPSEYPCQPLSWFCSLTTLVPLWQTRVCRCPGLSSWWGTSERWQPWQLFFVTEATPCCVCWRFCQRRTASSPCSQSACGCWHWWTHEECNGHKTAPPEHNHGTDRKKTTTKNKNCQEIWAIISQTVFLQSLFTIKILSQFYSTCVLLPVCWKRSRWWGCRLDSSWQSTLAWWQLEEECAALDL